MCALNDLGYKGKLWTYEKKVAGGSYTRVRLDQALYSASWLTQFPQAFLRHLTATTSDHSPIMLHLTDKEQTQRGSPQFKYELMWEQHEELKPAVIAGLDTSYLATSVTQVREKLKGLSADLLKWSTDSFGSVRKQIRDIKKELEDLQNHHLRVGPTHAELKIIEKLVEL